MFTPTSISYDRIVAAPEAVAGFSSQLLAYGPERLP
jgi:hypothetical protein